VKGIIGSLFRIKQAEVSTALEVAGGPKLKHLVVDSVKTANEILKHGNLKRKITIVPLDKINPDVMSTTVRQMANDHFGDKAKPALDFIEYDPDYSGVMNYIFGRVFICKVPHYLDGLELYRFDNRTTRLPRRWSIIHQSGVVALQSMEMTTVHRGY